VSAGESGHSRPWFTFVYIGASEGEWTMVLDNDINLATESNPGTRKTI